MARQTAVCFFNLPVEDEQKADNQSSNSAPAENTADKILERGKIFYHNACLAYENGSFFTAQYSFEEVVRVILPALKLFNDSDEAYKCLASAYLGLAKTLVQHAWDLVYTQINSTLINNTNALLLPIQKLKDAENWVKKACDLYKKLSMQDADVRRAINPIKKEIENVLTSANLVL